jgi:hypothetical protein
MGDELAPPACPRPAMSLLRGRLRVGEDFFARMGAVPAGVVAPSGLVDRLEDLARPGVDVARIDPAIVPFFLGPGSLRLRIRSRWHGAFAIAWALARPLMRAVGQLHLPWRSADVAVHTLALDAALDGRPGARGVVRRYTAGGVMQVIAYATHRWEGGGYMSAALPLPMGALCGVLRLDLLEDAVAPGAADGTTRAASTTSRCGARLTSRRSTSGPEPVGIWFAPLVGPSFRVPFEETLDLWPARAPSAPADLRARARPDDSIVGRHTQRFLGLRCVTHEYWFAGAAQGYREAVTGRTGRPPTASDPGGRRLRWRS